ncbi:MAG: O-linked N-acetylglucosamine transferase, SPINDLY family protein [Hormoscilla sp.]
MTNSDDSTDIVQQQGYKQLIAGEYSEACAQYQQEIEAEPYVRSNYWYLGLALLLQGEEVEAQVTWMLAIGEGDEEEVDQWTAELVEVLQTEAQRFSEQEDYAEAWAIRQHIREISPSDISNLLQLVQLSVKQGTLTKENLASWEVIELLKSAPKGEVNPDLLLQVVQNLLDDVPLAPFLPELVEACLRHVKDVELFIETVIKACVSISQNMKRPKQAISLAKLCVSLSPDHPEVWRHLASYYQNAGEYDEGVEAGKKCYSLMETLPDKVYANYLLLRGLMSAGGRWSEAVEVCDKQASLLESMYREENSLYHIITYSRLCTTSYFFPYFRDDLKGNRAIHNNLAQYCQGPIELDQKVRVDRYRTRHAERKGSGGVTKTRSLSGGSTSDTEGHKLKIGYMSHCLTSHSVGWLGRWLFEYHDREKYDIYGYFINYREKIKDPLQQWFVEHVSHARKLGMEYLPVAEQIYDDEIDILIDLDSRTLDMSCIVMALKPAPIQVSWLGWDAPGIPTVDYMIADPYVLPEEAQDYYSETIWRLPTTYVAVDGFEVAVPTLRRDQLEVESDAVLYFSSQRGYKRHPDTARLQLRIIKEVPNSYFLIKGFGDQDTIKTFFLQLAEEEGVSPDRLRFLSIAPSEATHRGNLGVADVVLDTYPYNGATTTLETLWMCVPLVTRVGEQFAARNSYTMMMNAGITEGIAWTDEEYVEWGVRLGEDPVLRQQISWRLRQSRQTAPLWNTKQFARDLENAYEQMWQKYVESGNGNV